MTTSPASGTGSSTSRYSSTSGPPNRSRTTAFIQPLSSLWLACAAAMCPASALRVQATPKYNRHPVTPAQVDSVALSAPRGALPSAQPESDRSIAFGGALHGWALCPARAGAQPDLGPPTIDQPRPFRAGVPRRVSHLSARHRPSARPDLDARDHRARVLRLWDRAGAGILAPGDQRI